MARLRFTPSLLCARPLHSLPRSHTFLAKRRYLSTSARRTSHRRTTDFNSGFTSTYDPSLDTGRGPMFRTKSFGVPQFYPRDLKKLVDEYVVGQHRAKKTICSTIFNHYQNLRRRHYQELEDRNLRAKIQRQKFARDRDQETLRDRDPQSGDAVHNSSDPVFQRYYADEYNEDDSKTPDSPSVSERVDADPLYSLDEPIIPPHVKIDKSNLLLIGPTGVGKTYILETLSKKLNVPFTISDCNSFTQAGYIGQDVEACIERLLIEANYDIRATEHGIIVLDEFDKIAKRETMNGRDVGGEGVQQALLKLVEGTKVTINIKDNRSSRVPPPTATYMGTGPSSSNPQSSAPQNRVEQYTIDTSNILFVFCGAFVGLEKPILRRVAKPSIGFGSEIRRPSSLYDQKSSLPRNLYTHLPHQDNPDGEPSTFTALDLTTPVDLQAFGFIPELIGRVHNICSLSPLSLDDLHRILTEPRNSLISQYTALFETYPSRLFFTQKSLYAIAKRAAKAETGARGLKMEMERVLAEPMFDAPMPYVLITEGCVNGTEKAGYWGKDGRMELERRMQEEDAVDAEEVGARGTGEQDVGFEQVRVAGQSGA